MGIPSGPELIIVLFIVILLFGAKKLPDLAKGLGQGIREFKKATNEEPEPKKKAAKKEADEPTEEKTNE